MFKREINPYPVTDRVTFRNVDKTINLTVRAAASPIVIGLKQANDRLTGMTDDTPQEERLEAARFFAEVIFGREQAQQLVDFYNGDALAVISACGMYFQSRLGKKITKAQKR